MLGGESADQEGNVRSEAPEMLTLIATPRAAAVLRFRADLGLIVRPPLEIAVSAGGVVLLATPADDLGAAPPEGVRIGVLDEPVARPDDDRFVDYVFPTATRIEITFRALLGLERGRVTPVLSPVAYGLDLGTHRVSLSALEERLMQRLFSAGGAPVSRADLERVIEDTGASVRGRALDAHIYRMRRKLRDATDVRIQTVRQRGFAIVSEKATIASVALRVGGS